MAWMLHIGKYGLDAAIGEVSFAIAIKKVNLVTGVSSRNGNALD